MQCVQVKLELGHKATIRTKPTPEGFTHDWTIFVRGPESSNIQHFVDKIVFYLHESFPKPKRVVKEPPYQVTESGYAGFLLPIEVYFRNKEDPKKVRFEYDLFLHLEGPPVNHIRCEKLTFQNPTEDFRRKLIKAGGVGILGPDGGTILGQQTEPLTDVFGPPIPKTKPSPEPVKKHKHITKESSSRTSTSSVSSAQEPFVALFGQPIKTAKSSPDPKKIKESVGKIAGSKGIKNGSSSSSSHVPNSNPPSIGKESKNTSSRDKEKRVNNDTKSNLKRTQSPSLNEMKIPVKEKSVSKRPPSPVTTSHELTKDTKKRKRSSSHSMTNTKIPREKQSENRKQAKIKEKEKKDTTKFTGEKMHHDTKTDGDEKITEDADVKTSKKQKQDKNKSMKENVYEKLKNDSKSTSMSSLDDSPNSSISFSSLHISGKQGPLGALMAELDDQDDDDELVSPLSSDSATPPRFSQKSDTPKSLDLPFSHEHKEKHSKKFSLTKSSSIDENSENNASYSSPGDTELSHLINLQRQITLIQDRDNLQKIVDILEETGLYAVNSETLDFDLCALDKETLKKIQSCLVAAC